MGFIRQQEERLAIKLLAWQYEKKKIPLPDPLELKRHAARIVDDAHGIATERGRNVIGIIKELVEEIRKR